ncbi:MAG: hypothetical protein GXP05_07955 [Alphaproteobacteria bacterium]|nr:hypothetical protein [Alphaproteobacteria bacterium]
MKISNVLVGFGAVLVLSSCAKFALRPAKPVVLAPVKQVHTVKVSVPVKHKPKVKIATIVPTIKVPAAPAPVETATIKTITPRPRPIKPERKFLAASLAKLMPKARKTASIAPCANGLVDAVPTRAANALTGSEFVSETLAISGAARDKLVEQQILSGNVPGFLRDLTPVTLKSVDESGVPFAVTICVAPDYLSVGSNADFVRVPMGLPTAADVVGKLGFILPTTKMVDAIYQQAGLRLAPSPMQASKQMSSTEYLWKHNQTVQSQRAAQNKGQDVLVAGQKKDIVLSNALWKTPGRVAIYGWHRKNGKPIQPLSTVHQEAYADYSHGVRLISKTAYVNGEPRALTDLLSSPKMARALSKEGPIRRPDRLLASISTK